MLQADSPKTASANGHGQPFLSDVKQLRERARMNIEKGPITASYQGNVQQVIEILQSSHPSHLSR